MEISELFEALEQNPSDLQTLDAIQNACIEASDQENLERAYATVLARLEDPKDVEGVLRRIEMKVRQVPNEELQMWMQFYIGFQYWTRLQNPDKAEMLFRKLGTEEGPYFPVLTDFYKQFYADKENWRRLEDLLMKAEGGETDAQAALNVKRHLAQLATEKDKKDKAIAFWQGVRQLDPEDDEAEAALKKLYIDVQKWHSLIELLNEKLGRLGADAIDEKIAIQLEMVAIFRDHIKSETKVNSAYQAILELQPGNEMALNALVEQFTAMKRWPDLVRVLQQKVEHTTDTATLVKLHREIASIMMEKFSNSSEAIKSYTAILALDPRDREAIATLKDVYDKRRDWEHYVEISLSEVDLIESEDEKHTATVALAELASERIRKPSMAIDLWARVLAYEPDNRKALDHLEQLYEREKDFPQLVQVLERKLSATQERAPRLEILRKLGGIYGTRLEDDARTVETWKRVLELEPDDRIAQADLKKRFLRSRDWAELEWFFRNFGTVEELVRTIESQVGSIEEDQEKIELLFKAARIWREELDNTRRAVKSLENVLAIAPEHLPAAEMLIPIYRELEQWDSLPPVIEIKLAHTEDTGERERWYVELAQIHETHLGDPSQAFFNYVEAYKANWHDEHIHAELERLAAASANWDSYVVVLEETLDRVDDPVWRIRYRTRIAQVQAGELKDDASALASYLKVLEEDADNRTALDAIEGLYRKMSRWSDLIDVLQRKLALEESPDARKDIMFQLGQAWRDFMSNNEEAVRVYRDMLEQFPDEARVHEELSNIFLEEEDYPALRDVLELRLSLLQRQDAAAGDVATVQCDLGMLTYGTGEATDLDPVIDRYQQALDTDPDSERAVALLEELLASEAARPRIAQILEPVYERREVWPKLADIHEIQLQQMASDEVDREARIRLLERLGGLYRDRLSDAALAFRSYARIFRLDPVDDSVRPHLESLAGQLGRWEELVQLYRDEVERIDVPEIRLDVLLTVARLYHNQIEDLEAAQAFYNLVLEIDPAHAASLDALEEIYLLLERWEELLSVYTRKFELATDDATRIRYQFEVSRLWRDRLKNPDEAIAAALRILDIDPRHKDALQHLDDLYAVNERWDDLAETLKRLIGLAEEAADVDQVVALEVRLAQVQEERQGDVEAAIATYASIIELDRANEPALAALERLFGDPDWNRLIAPILEPHYQRQGNWERLIDVYMVEESNAGDDLDQRVALRFKISQLYEERGFDPASAFVHYAEAYRLVPEREDTLAALLRLSETLANHEELVLLIEERVDDVVDVHRKREIHRVAARLSRDHVGDVERAKKHFRAILEIDPDDLPALDALIELHRGQQEWESLVDVLLQKAPLVPDVEERKILYFEAGELADARLEDAERAIEIYAMLRQLDPADPTALDPLQSLYERVGNWPELVAVYSEKIDRSNDLDEKKRYAADKARVQAEKQEALDDAVETWRAVLGWDAADLHALRELDDLYTLKEDWYSLLEILQRQMELVDEDERLALQFRAGQVHETKLEDMLQAIEAYRTVLAVAPDHEGARAALVAIVREKDERAQAFEVLRPVLRDAGEWPTLLELYEVIVAAEPDDFRKIDLYTTMGEIAELRLDQPTRAFEFYGEAFRKDVERPATVAQLERLAAEHDLWEPIVALYVDGAEDAMSPEVQLSLRLKVGSFLKDRIGDDERAVKHYTVLLEDYPDNQEVLGALDELYELREEWPTLADVLRREIEIHDDVAQKIALQFRLGAVAEERLGDKRQAFEVYSDALLLDRNNADTVAHLERLFQDTDLRIDIADQLELIYVERQDWFALHRMLELKLEVITDEADRLDLLRRLATLNLETLDRKPDAVNWLGQAFVLDPEDEGMLAQLFDLVEQTDQWADLVEVLLAAVERVQLDDRKVELWHRAAKVLEERLFDRERAEVMYHNVLGVDDENLEALKSLDRIYTGLERWQDLEGILRREIEVQPYDDDKVELLTRLAELYRDRLDRWDEAVASFRKILEIYDNHRPTLLALAEIYETRSEWTPLFEISESLANVAENDAERVGYLSRMARIAEEQIGDQKEAVRLWEEVLTVRADDRDAVHELQRLMGALGDWNGYVETCERELRMGVAEAERRVDLYKEIGRTWRDRLEDPFQAQGAFERVLEEQPEDREALEALRALYRENEAYEPLVGVLERLIVLGGYDDEVLTGLWRELAQIKTTVTPEPKDAIHAWQSVLEYVPEDAEAIEALEALYESESQWQPCVDIIQRKVNLLDNADDKIDALMRAARIQLDNLTDPRAAAQTYEQILALQPANYDASSAVEKIYEGQQDYPALADLLQRRVQTIDEPADKVFVLQNLARLYEEKLQSVEGAFDMLYQALQVEPTEPQTLFELERVTTQAGMWEELSGIYAEVIPQTKEPHLVVEYLTKWAVMLRDRLGRPGEAIERFRQVLEHDPEHEETLRALVALYESEERWDDMIGAVSKLIEVIYDAQEQVLFQRRIGEVYEEKLEDRESAIAAYLHVLEFEETDGVALAALERLYSDSHRWDDLIGILRQQAQAAPERDTELKLRVGEIYELRLEQPEEAIAVYEELLNFDPTNGTALSRLEALYFEREDWQKLTEVYERLFNVAQTPEERVNFCKNLAQLYETAFNDPEQAADAYKRILEIQPGNAEALGAMERIYAGEGSWEDLIEVHLRWFELSDDPATRADRLNAAAGVYAERLDDLDNAIRTYERVLEIDPANGPALDALEGLYRRTEQWEQVVEVLTRKAEAGEDAHVRSGLEAARGEVLRDQIHDVDGAIAAFEAAFHLETGPESVPLGRKLVEVYEQAERWEDAIQTLRTIHARAATKTDRADAYCDIAGIYHRHLSDRDGAVDAYERTLELNPEHDRALFALATLYTEEGQWVRALPRLEMQLARVDAESDPERALALYRQIAVAAENVLDEQRALDFYERSYHLDPTDTNTLGGLARLYYKTGNYTKSRRFYQEIIAAAESDMTPDQLVETYTALGNIAFKLDDAGAATEYLEKVLLYQPENLGAIQELVKLAQQSGDWQAAIRYKHELKNATSNELEKLNILIEIGDTYKDRLDDENGAVASYREALSIRPDSRAANIKLLEIFIESKRFDEAVAVLEKLVEATDDPVQKSSYCFTIAVIYRDQMHDDDRAVEYLDKTLDLNPDRKEAFAYIDEIMTRKRDWKTQARYYRKMIQRIRGMGKTDLEFLLYRNLGEIYRSRMKNFEYAVSAFALAAQLKPKDVQVHEILAELYSFGGDYDKAVAEHIALLTYQPDRIASYRAIKQLSLDTRKIDRAWLSAGVLGLLNQATEEEQKFYRQHRAPSVKEARGSLDANLWRTHVFADPTDFLVGQMFQVIYQGIGGMLEAKDLKDLGLKKRDELQPKKELMFLNTLRNVSRVLGIASPRVFLSERSMGVRIEGTMPPILLVGPDQLQGKTEAEMAFLIGKLLNYFHPMHLLAGMYPIPMLQTLLVCAWRYCYPDEPVGVETPQVEAIVREMNKAISQQLKYAFVRAMDQFRKAHGSVLEYDLQGWLGRVELTADHAGLLCCGDVEMSGRLISAEAAAMSPLPVRDKVKDLVLYAVDTRFAELREKLGLKIS